MTTPTIPGKATVVTALGLLLTACASVPQQSLEERLTETVVERTGQGLARVDEAALEQQVTALLAEPLDREAALRVALSANRSFQAEFAALGVAAADYHANLVVPNPMVDVELLWPGSGGRPAWDLGLTQSVMALLTRPARRAIAESTLEARERESLERVLGLMHAVERAWVHAVTDAEVAAMLDTAVAVAAAGVDTAEALYEVGNLPRIDLVREQRFYAHTRLRAARAEARAHASREALLRAMGVREQTAQVRLPERLPAPPDVGGEVDDLERVAVTASLQLAALEAEIVAAARAARLAEGTALLPHLELGVKAERDRAGDWELGPAVEFALPVFDRGRGRTTRAIALLEQRRAVWWQAAVELRSQARVAARELAWAAQDATLARETLLPLAGELLSLTVRDWNAMLAGPFELLDARRGQLDMALETLEAHRRQWLAQLTIEQLQRGARPAVDSSMTPVAAGRGGRH